MANGENRRRGHRTGMLTWFTRVQDGKYWDRTVNETKIQAKTHAWGKTPK